MTRYCCSGSSVAIQMEKTSSPYESIYPDKDRKVYAWFSSETGIYRSKHKPIELPSNPEMDIVSFIFSHKHQGTTALIDSSSGFSISYKKFQEMVGSFASGLHGIGIAQSQVVLILLPNSIYFPVIALGILSIGAIITTMNPLSSFAEIKKQVTDSNVILAFTLSEHVKKIQELGIQVIAVPETGNFNPSSSNFAEFYRILSSNPDFRPNSIIKQQDTAALLYSSGTSGTSKGVVLTHSNLIASIELFVRFEASQYPRPGWENVYLALIPMFHVYGFSVFVTGLLSLGSIIVVMKKFNVKQMLESIDRYGVTHFPLVPSILMALTRSKGDSKNGKESSLKQVSCGAAPLSRKTIQDFLQKFPNVDFIQGYGMTESTAVGTRGFNTRNVRKYFSVGLLAPNMEAKIVDYNNGCFLSPGKSGELWLRGPGTMKSYLNNPEETKSTIDVNGWLHTGDVAYFDEDGFVYILDRWKELIKYNGFQVAPGDLEAVMESHPEIVDVAVISAPDETTGEIPVAFVVKKPGSSLSSNEVMEYVNKQVAPYKKIRKVIFTHFIPRSPAGKILRRKLRSQMLLSRI